MALKIRLARSGAKKNPFYRIVVTDSRNPRDGRFIEKIGRHNPLLDHDNEERIVVNAERFNYWIGVGAKPSDRVAILCSKLGLCERPAISNQTKKSQMKQKALERLQEKEEAAKAAAEAAAAAEAEAKAAAEEASDAPAEEKAEA